MGDPDQVTLAGMPLDIMHIVCQRLDSADIATLFETGCKRLQRVLSQRGCVPSVQLSIVSEHIDFKWRCLLKLNSGLERLQVTTTEMSYEGLDLRFLSLVNPSSLIALDFQTEIDLKSKPSTSSLVMKPILDDVFPFARLFPKLLTFKTNSLGKVFSVDHPFYRSPISETIGSSLQSFECQSAVFGTLVALLPKSISRLILPAVIDAPSHASLLDFLQSITQRLSNLRHLTIACPHWDVSKDQIVPAGSKPAVPSFGAPPPPPPPMGNSSDNTVDAWTVSLESLSLLLTGATSNELPKRIIGPNLTNFSISSHNNMAHFPPLLYCLPVSIETLNLGIKEDNLFEMREIPSEDRLWRALPPNLTSLSVSFRKTPSNIHPLRFIQLLPTSLTQLAVYKTLELFPTVDVDVPLTLPPRLECFELRTIDKESGYTAFLYNWASTRQVSIMPPLQFPPSLLRMRLDVQTSHQSLLPSLSEHCKLQHLSVWPDPHWTDQHVAQIREILKNTLRSLVIEGAVAITTLLSNDPTSFDSQDWLTSKSLESPLGTRAKAKYSMLRAESLALLTPQLQKLSMSFTDHFIWDLRFVDTYLPQLTSLVDLDLQPPVGATNAQVQTLFLRDLPLLKTASLGAYGLRSFAFIYLPRQLETIIATGDIQRAQYYNPPATAQVPTPAATKFRSGSLFSDAPSTLQTVVLPNLVFAKNAKDVQKLPRTLTRLAFQSQDYQDFDIQNVVLSHFTSLRQLELTGIILTGQVIPPSTKALSWQSIEDLTFAALHPLHPCPLKLTTSKFQLPQNLQRLELDTLPDSDFDQQTTFADFCIPRVPRPSHLVVRAFALYPASLIAIHLDRAFSVISLDVQLPFAQCTALQELWLPKASSTSRDPFRFLPSSLTSLKIDFYAPMICDTHNLRNLPSKMTELYTPGLRLYPDSVPLLPPTLQHLSMAGGSFWTDSDIRALQERLTPSAEISLQSALLTGRLLSPATTSLDWDTMIQETDKALGSRVRTCHWEAAMVLELPCVSLTSLDLRCPIYHKVPAIPRHFGAEAIEPTFKHLNWQASVAPIKQGLQSLTMAIEHLSDFSCLSGLPSGLTHLSLHVFQQHYWNEWIWGALPRSLSSLTVEISVPNVSACKLPHLEGLPSKLETLVFPLLDLDLATLKSLPTSLIKLRVNLLSSLDKIDVFKKLPLLKELLTRVHEL